MCVYACKYVSTYARMYVRMYVHICNWIWKNVHSSHIRVFNFGDSWNLFEMTDRCQTSRDCKITIHLSSLKFSNMYTTLFGCYGSPNEQNRMCELYMFSKIQSHILVMHRYHLLATHLILMLFRYVENGQYQSLLILWYTNVIHKKQPLMQYT